MENHKDISYPLITRKKLKNFFDRNEVQTIILYLMFFFVIQFYHEVHKVENEADFEILTLIKNIVNFYSQPFIFSAVFGFITIMVGLSSMSDKMFKFNVFIVFFLSALSFYLSTPEHFLIKSFF